MLSRCVLLVASFAVAMLTACASTEPAPTTSTSSEIHDPPPESCWDQCFHAGQTCPLDCGVSSQDCADATTICYDSCGRGVGPWLPC